MSALLNSVVLHRPCGDVRPIDADSHRSDLMRRPPPTPNRQQGSALHPAKDGRPLQTFEMMRCPEDDCPLVGFQGQRP
jgi:hypothetical protein